MNGVSKAYAMTGCRLGYICASKEITDAAQPLHKSSSMASDVWLHCHLPKGAFYAFPSIEGMGLSYE